MRRSAPADWGVHVGRDGFRDVRSKDDDHEDAFVDWNEKACEHDQGYLVQRFLGIEEELNVLHARLARTRLPMIRAFVHAEKLGAMREVIVSPQETRKFASEIERLARLHVPERVDEALLRLFEARLRELLTDARAVGKPICVTLDDV